MKHRSSVVRVVRSRTALLALSVVMITTVAASTFAVARVTAPASSVVACKARNDTLVVPTARGACPQATTKVTLGARGPRGLQGPTGAPGTSGADGADGTNGTDWH